MHKPPLALCLLAVVVFGVATGWVLATAIAAPLLAVNLGWWAMYNRRHRIAGEPRR